MGDDDTFEANFAKSVPVLASLLGCSSPAIGSGEHLLSSESSGRT